ncbi:MAG: right-handed parallel beta-helix repeat-containing protein, partial [Pseudomonadota bacterium]
MLAACMLLSGCLVEPDFGEPPDMARFNDTQIGYCPQYDQSPLYRNRTTSVIVYPDSNWINTIESAAPNTEILFEDGDYNLNQYAVRIRAPLTIRSVSADPARVRIRGMGYGTGSEGFMVLADNVTIADVSISNIRNHAVAVNPQSGASRGLQLYNLNISDIGTQHIKVNPGGATDGLIACSTIGYSNGGAQGDYNGAVNLHNTFNFTVRDNYIYNINGDGSGCEVDEDCGRYISSPAILAWNGGSGTRVIGNTIVDSFRNIAFGIGNAHNGGSILHNTIIQSAPGDAGIELFGATGAVVEFNTVQLNGRYPGAIEYRRSANLTITNNWLT